MGGKLIAESRLLNESLPERPAVIYYAHRYVYVEMRTVVSWLKLIKTQDISFLGNYVKSCLNIDNET